MSTREATAGTVPWWVRGRPGHGPEARHAVAARDLLLPEKRWMAAWDRYMADRAPARPRA